MTEHDPNPLDALCSSVADEEQLDPRVADRIESQLRIAHAATRGSGSRSMRPALVATMVLFAVIALSVLVTVRDPNPSAALVMTDAENVTVRLVDGTVITDPSDGFELPDGAVVEIGIGGMVTVDDVVLDSVGVLEVRDGRLVADVVATTTTADQPAPEVTTAEPATDTVSTTTSIAPTPTTTTPPRETTTTSRAPDTTTTVRDGRDDSPRDPERERDDGSNRRDDSRSDEPAPDESPSDEPQRTVAITLDLERIDRGVRLVWDVDGLEPGWMVLISRRVGDQAPTTVATSTASSGDHVDEPTRDDGRPIDGRLRYRVVIVDEAGGEVAAGPSQSLR